MNFHNGLSGVAWGLNYLSEHYDFDSENSLNHLDAVIFERLNKSIEPGSQSIDVFGLGFYYSTRFRKGSSGRLFINDNSTNIISFFNEEFIKVLIRAKPDLGSPLTQEQLYQLLFYLINTGQIKLVELKRLFTLLLKSSYTLDSNAVGVICSIVLINFSQLDQSKALFDGIENFHEDLSKSPFSGSAIECQLHGWRNLWYEPSLFNTDEKELLKSSLIQQIRETNIAINNRSLIALGLSLLNIVD